MKKILTFLAVSFALLMASQSALAAGVGVSLPNPLCLNNGTPTQVCSTEPRCDGSGWQTNFPPNTYTSPSDCCTKLGGTTTTISTCVKDFPTLLSSITKYVTGLIASIAVVIFIYAGFLYLTSAGNPEKISRGNKAVLFACIGIAIALAGAGLVAVITAIIGPPPA